MAKTTKLVEIPNMGRLEVPVYATKLGIDSGMPFYLDPGTGEWLSAKNIGMVAHNSARDRLNGSRDETGGPTVYDI